MTVRLHRLSTGVLGLCLLSGLATGCGLGARQARADRLAVAFRLASSAGVGEGAMSVSMSVDRTPLPIPGLPRRADSPFLTVSMDLRNSRATYTPPPTPATRATPVAGVASLSQLAARLGFGGKTAVGRQGPGTAGESFLGGGGPEAALAAVVDQRPSASFAGFVVYMHRAPPPPGAAPSRRQWVVLDYSGLTRPQLTGLSVANSIVSINPVFLLRLLTGSLAGSTRDLGHQVLNGFPAEHYAMNVSPEKAARGLSDHDQSAWDKQFRANSISGSVFAAQAWIDSRGLPWAFQVTLLEKLSESQSYRVTVRFEQLHFPVPSTVALPDRGQTVEVTSLPDLLAEARTS